jgi:hypothetical protein
MEDGFVVVFGEIENAYFQCFGGEPNAKSTPPYRTGVIVHSVAERLVLAATGHRAEPAFLFGGLNVLGPTVASDTTPFEFQST